MRTCIEPFARLNLLGVLLVRPGGQCLRLSMRSYWHSLSGEEVIVFLQQILRKVKGPIVLLWDRHPMHRRRTVQEFLATQTRLHVYYFPVAAPDLNPTEFLWTQLTEYLAGTAPHNRQELQAQVFAGIARTRQSQHRLHACLLGSQLQWIN